ncbi:hypothetical protein [Planomicrobium sp. MB-3u-38]|uniref:hypothetical protein n=1 Tax=Planomicrobium sp. MB-3u-38 TaxID=2058318 RepID=UPI0011AE68C2|nr:hypothetical protein [Planomicrobium sp. MB-3u-38]
MLTIIHQVLVPAMLKVMKHSAVLQSNPAPEVSGNFYYNMIVRLPVAGYKQMDEPLFVVCFFIATNYI